MKRKNKVYVVMMALLLCLCDCGCETSGGKQDQGAGGAMQLVPQEGEHYYITTYGILTTPVNAGVVRVGKTCTAP